MATEKRLIDLDKIKPMDFPSTEMDGLDVVRYLNTLPTVDAVEVVHSKWEITDVEHAYGTKCYHCPECGEDEWRHDEPNYCPNCGAKMDGDVNGYL